MKVKLTTSQGPIVIELDETKAPVSSANFLQYVDAGHYDGTIFHRVIDGFMAHTGDPTGTGTGGSKEPDLPAEFSKAHFARGTVGMADPGVGHPDPLRSLAGEEHRVRHRAAAYRGPFAPPGMWRPRDASTPRLPGR